MKYLTSLLLSLAMLASSAVAAETAPMTGLRSEEYRSGQVHSKLMGLKRETYARNRAAGVYDCKKYKSQKKPAKCKNGVATTEAGDKFKCKNVDLAYFLNHAELGSVTGEGSSMWGWTSPDGREFAAVGQADGAAFVEVVNKTGALIYLGRLPQPKGVKPEIWREIRMMDHYAIIGSEAEGHGVQIWDMRKVSFAQ